MKCQKCGSEWNSKVKSIDCPFCREKLEPEVNSDFTNISEVLKYIVNTYGVEVYTNTSLLLAYVSDLAPRLETEKRLLKICAESGVVTQFAENSNMVADEQEIFVKKSEATLCNQYFLNESAARNVLSWLVYSIGWAYQTNEEAENEIFKYKTGVSIEDNEKKQVDALNKGNIIAVFCGKKHTVGLKKDGTVVATGENMHGQCNVSEWKDIIAVSCGYRYTIGLKKDGTVVATGENTYGQCNVSEWKDIIAVSCGFLHTIGLKKDGTVVATGGNYGGRCNVPEWKDIIAVSCGSWHTIGLKRDGTIVATGNNEDGQCNVSKWNNT